MVVASVVLSICDSPATRIESYRYALLVSEGLVIISIILYWVGLEKLYSGQKNRGLKSRKDS